jgi:CheY-like chemotaxis protein
MYEKYVRIAPISFAGGSKKMDEQGKALRILIVDDDAEFLSVTEEYLGMLGYDVTGILSPIEAFEAASKKNFDLIISDYKMPEISGLTLLEEIRGNGIATPVLLVSGCIDTITEEAVIGKGGSGLVLKPFRLSDLEHAVRRAIANG